jgi:hypothetical protein
MLEHVLGQKYGEIFPRHVLAILVLTTIKTTICHTFNTLHPICMYSWNALPGRFSLHTAGKEMPDQVGHDGVIRVGHGAGQVVLCRR